MARRRGKGEGSIYQRGDGRWYGSISLGWEDGRRRRKTVNAKTRAEVVEKMRRLEQIVKTGVRPAPERLTVGEYLDGWLTERVPGTVTVRTEDYYRQIVRLHLKPLLGHVRLNQLAPADVSKLLATMEQRGYSPATRRSVRATLRRALRIAEQDGILARNAAAIAEGPKMNHREGRTLTPEEARRFLEALEGHRLAAAFNVTLALGLRRGEVLGLSWADLEPNGAGGAVLTVRRQLVRDPDGLNLVNLKTRGSRRTLHVSPTLLSILELHRDQQAFEAEAAGDGWSNNHDLMFTSTSGGPLDVDAFGKIVPRICKEIGLGHWSIHELRHSCASLMLHEEVPLEVVSEAMGHSSIRMTKDVYGHLMPRSREKAATAMDAVLFGADVQTDPDALGSVAARLAATEPSDDHEEGEKRPLIRGSVRPSGFEPETCGLRVASWSSIRRRIVHMACSEVYSVSAICSIPANTTPLSSDVVAGCRVGARMRTTDFRWWPSYPRDRLRALSP
jgi:integrase